MIRDDVVASPVQQVPISFTGSGDQILAPGVAGRKLAILQFFFIVSAPVTLTFRSGSATLLTGPMPFLANGAQVQDFIQLPLSCNDGDSFICNASTSVTLGGTLWYASAPSIK